jgi:hypothetical protein
MRDGAERVTCDSSVWAERVGRGRTELRSGMVIVETKSDDGDSPADCILSELGIELRPLSKHRVALAVLTGEAHPPDAARPFEILS